MVSLNLRQKFDPLDLEIIDRVYDVARAYMEACNLYRNAVKDAQEEDVVRKQVFALAGSARLDFDALCDRVLIEQRRSTRRATKCRTKS
jgi:hypothetical protein